MKSSEPKTITVFEHETIRFDKGARKITKGQFEALQLYHGNGVPYFNLCYNGIKFNSYVGVIQVGNTVIEVLPKGDKNPKTVSEETKWRKLLIDMIRAVGTFEIYATSISQLKLKPNTILDLYFEIFIKEAERLLHNGLVKKYRLKESNETALKGRLVFSKHINQNLIHKERFYTSYNHYDAQHQLHCIIYKVIRLLKQVNINADLHSRIGALLLNFPEMPDIKVTQETFDKISFNRKTQDYRNAIEISRLLLLQYHPDISTGQNNVLALMFDMNQLWEKFIFVSLKKGIKNSMITAQTSKHFWKPMKGESAKIRPDIFIKTQNEQNIVLDTKWKILGSNNPSADDLRQIYVYHEYFEAEKVALVYPDAEMFHTQGTFFNTSKVNIPNKECSIIKIGIAGDITQWQKNINKIFEKWFNEMPETSL